MSFQLGEQKRSKQVRRQVTRSQVDPAILGSYRTQRLHSGTGMITLVRGVIRHSSRDSSIFMVSARTSENTIFAPRNTNAFAVDTKVNDGRITSSPGATFNKSADISSASVHEVAQEYSGNTQFAFQQFVTPSRERAVT